jgi:sulfite exporter TauE/SafE
MESGLIPLYITAATLGFMHTVFGPDHYIPFIVMARARKWTLLKTAILTIACGIGHIMSSVAIGIAGIVFGIAVMKLETVESQRGNIAGWALLSFGFAYFIWGLHQAIKNRPHGHVHIHGDAGLHAHEHPHAGEHAHVHAAGKKNITPWILFTIFVLGPCEPLIPVLMYPAVKNSIAGVVGVTVIFGVVTIVTMLSIVIIASLGMNILPFEKLERYNHALAGAAILLCGIAINFLGL